MSQKIYIVEDEPDIRETLKYNFSNEGFKVFTAPDGEEALSNIKKAWANSALSWDSSLLVRYFFTFWLLSNFSAYFVFFLF